VIDIEHKLSPLPDSIGATLLEGEERLKSANTLRPRRHAELLLEKVLSVDRTALYLRAHDRLTLNRLKNYNKLLERRANGEPVQYITGWAPFYDRRFMIGSGVFIPRFDTELLIERLIACWEEDCIEEENIEALDICCGCGAIGLTVALELPRTNVTLVDISSKALKHTVRNAIELNIEDHVHIIKRNAMSDPLDEWHGKFHYILANPPYIPSSDIHKLHSDVQSEPHDALTDGGDGLAFYRRWAQTLPFMLRPGGRFFIEIGVDAADRVCEIFSGTFSLLKITRDLNGIERVVEGVM